MYSVVLVSQPFRATLSFDVEMELGLTRFISFRVDSGARFTTFAHSGKKNAYDVADMVVEYMWKNNFSFFEIALCSEKVHGLWHMQFPDVFHPEHVSKEIKHIMTQVINPETKIQQTLWSCIQNLNDAYGWSREKIADWIDTLDFVPVFS